MPGDHRLLARGRRRPRRRLSATIASLRTRVGRALAPYNPSVQRALLASTRVLSTLLVVLGLVLVILSLARGGGPLALGVVLGAMLTAIGALRLWFAR